MSRKNLNKEIRALADRVNAGEVSFLDVQTKVLQRVQSVTGDPHMEEDPETMEASRLLAQALAEAFLRQQREIVQDTMYRLGFGVGKGTLGASFFKKITGKKV